jgi:hypothetical protein
MIAVDTLPRHPSGRDARVEGALQHLLRQLRFGRKGPLRWYPCALASCLIVGPFFRHIEVTIQ